MTSKIKVDTIENVAGSGNVSLGSGHNLVVPGNNTTSGNATVGGTLGVTGTTTIGNGTSGVAKINGGSSSSGQIIFMDAGTNRARIGVPTGTTTLSLSGSNSLTGDVVIDVDGRVTEPSQPSFLAKGANGAYITTSPIPFPTVSGSGVNMAAHNIGNHYNTSNYTFTAPVAGRYFFHVHLGIVRGATSSAQMYPTLLVNGNGVAYTYAKIEVAPTSNNYLNCSVTQVLSLSANDAVKVNFNQSGSGTYYNGAAESSFMGYLLG